MMIVGISGGLEPVYRPRFFAPDQAHDAAAALVVDGDVAWAIEEERLNRVKHSNAVPVEAIRRCLRNNGSTIADVDVLAIYGEERALDAVCRAYAEAEPAHACARIREHVHRLLREELGGDLPDERLAFVNHHLCHATSTYVPSGFDTSLVVTIDGVGDHLSGMVLSGRSGRLKVLRELPEAQSLGYFYTAVVKHLGFGDFDEYKVMGLAPYGDPAAARDAFRRMYALLPHGDYRIHWEQVKNLAGALGPVRPPDEALAQRHMDVASALQEALEEIVFHVLQYWRETSGHTNLCLAGGVAQNCSLNGRLLASSLFRDIFVQPASHDAGCALGAAWHCGPPARAPRARLRQVFWGSDAGSAAGVERCLARWHGFVDYRRADNPSAAAARLLAEGCIVGWVQGRSEFGPRALGNRSILADPRPAANKDIVNAAVKKREAFRPFAPAVLEERAAEYFDLATAHEAFAFMTFVVDVRRDKRALLGAVTHVDGTARVQTVSRATNPRFWDLIAAFERLTGVPIVLNTSFNNNAEPIVDSVDDAIACFLTTGLHRLIVGDFVVDKAAGWESRLCAMAPAVPAHVALEKRIDRGSKTRVQTACWLVSRQRRKMVSEAAFELLERAMTADASRGADASPVERPADAVLAPELLNLWAERWISLRPEMHVAAAEAAAVLGAR